jgi:4-hydroxybenzoate polyprenyltransferase
MLDTKISPLLAWLRLCRAPNVFTALADVSMGFLVARQALDELGIFVCLLASSAGLYMAGMVLNDVFDVEVDRKERPFRPLPSGQIALPTARMFGFGLLIAGIVLGTAAGYVAQSKDAVPDLPWRSGAMAVLLAGSVLLYDGFLKKTPFGPVGMGLCRFFNVLLGMSVGHFATGPAWLLSFEYVELLPAAGIGLYIVGVTWFAKGEAGRSPVLHLLGGMTVMIAGIAVIGWWGSLFHAQRINPGINAPYFWLLLLVMLIVSQRRCLEAVLNPEPPQVQAAIKQCIFSLILFDAAITVFGTGKPEFGLGIALLIAPTMLLGRWVYST